jgi:hypothetical protein
VKLTGACSKRFPKVFETSAMETPENLEDYPGNPKLTDDGSIQMKYCSD